MRIDKQGGTRLLVLTRAIPAETVYMSTMDLSSLNVDVLLYLLKYVKPVDRFNLVLSGILKGFENVNKGIHLDERVEYCEAELDLIRGGMCELEIRSLKIKVPYFYSGKAAVDRLLNILQWLAEKGFLENTRQLIMTDNFSCSPRFFDVICSLENLETLDLPGRKLTHEQLPRVFSSCPKLVELHLNQLLCDNWEMDEELKNELRSGFQRLKIFKFECYIDYDSWLVIQEMLTWLKECVSLDIENSNKYMGNSFPIDDSLSLDPDLTQNLQKLRVSEYIPAGFIRWILSSCLHIRTFSISVLDKPGKIVPYDDFFRLKKLKVVLANTSYLREILRNCRQLEILEVLTDKVHSKDFANLEYSDNMTEVKLISIRDPAFSEELLPFLKRWRHLRRLTLLFSLFVQCDLPLKALCDFITEMKHLTYLNIGPKYSGQLLPAKVNEIVLPRRPNFKFCTSSFNFKEF